MLALRVSAALMCLVALGFGVPAPFVAGRLLREGRLPTFMGLFPMYGGGAFDRWPHTAFVVALGLFAALSALELFAAWLLWQGERLGALMAIALLPIEIVFWVGFAVPIPPVVAIVRAVLLAVGRSALRG
ncbi:MAG TPA: hypothetical protein VFN74_04195 [Chloroflexota bacterium]|nr:hypothetical protein [Chloroflexota bacterium]